MSQQRCYGCGAPDPALGATYAHFTALFCHEGCRRTFHRDVQLALEKTKQPDESSGEKKSRREKVKETAKKAVKTGAKNAKTAGKVAKVVAPLVLVRPYQDSGTESSAASFHESQLSDSYSQ